MSRFPKIRYKDYSEDWKQNSLGEVCEAPMYGLNSSAKDYDGINKYIRITDIDESTNLYNPNPLTSPESFTDEYLLKPNDLVFARTGASVGKSYLYNSNDGRLLFAGFLIRFRVKSTNNSKFIFYQTLLDRYSQWVKVNSARSGQPGINAEEFKTYELNLPTLEEQTKIATFLSAVDSKITSLERLVSHWQAYKKGIMQQIFTQQLRFKAPIGEDFPEWETKTLGEIGSTYNGLSGKTKDDFGSGFPYITYKSVFDNSRVDINRVEYVKVFISSNVEDKSEKQNKVEYGDIFFTVSSETPTEVGMSSVLLDEIDNCYLNSFCFGYRLNDKVSFNPKFFQHYLRSSEMRKCISILAQGSTRYNISASNMMNLEIIVPSSEEQTKIATFLSSLDDKIAHLQQQLTSYRQFKKALLQQMFV